MTNKDEQIGFHKGAIATLLKERVEVIKMMNVVNALLNAHVQELKKLGVDITKPAPADTAADGGTKGKPKSGKKKK